MHALSTMSYYDLINGYQDIFMIDNKYIENMSIEYLYTFHLFDNKFQNILFRQSVFIENVFKTRLSHIIAKNHGVHQNDYLNEKHYFAYAKDNQRTNFINLRDNIERVYTNKKYCNNIPQPTRHYLKEHNHIPPWILFKNISFGNSIDLYRLLKPKEKREITNAMMTQDSLNYTQKVDFLTNSLNIIRSFRNQIAHNLKFVTYKTLNPIAPKTIKKISPPFLYTNSDIEKKTGANDIYALIMSIVILLDDPFLVSEFLHEILNHISSVNDPLLGEQEKGIPETLYMDYSEITRLPLNLAERINKLIMSYK